MQPDQVTIFLSQYPDPVFNNALKLRKLLLKTLPGITEQLDLPAKVVGYAYGQKYSETICVLIPSKKGIKLGFYKGNELPDPDSILEGSGKITRYVEIKDEKQIGSPAIGHLLKSAMAAYKERTALH